MTSVVAIRCRDGIVIGTDSSATFGDGGQVRTIEQPTERKIEIVGGRVIVAGTGYVGHGQRFVEVVQKLHDAKAFSNKSEIEIAKMLSSEGIKDFSQTHLQNVPYAAFVAYPAGEKPCLCELPSGGQVAFQPEIKRPDDLWFASAGSGQQITDPLLALFRQIFWSDGPPNLEGGIFTAMWALLHACQVNPGGIKEPVRIAVLERNKGQYRARKLDDDELSEHENMVADANRHMAQFKDVLEGKSEASEVPKPAPKTQS